MNYFITLKDKIKYIIISIIVVAIIAFLTGCRLYAPDIFPRIPQYIFVSYGIYVTMLGLWLFSIRNQIIEEGMKRLITYIAILLIFLLTIRTIKWQTDNHKLAQILWYMYYIPFILMPLFLSLIAISLDKNLYQKLKKKLHLLIGFSIILMLFVLTNNLHQQVFKILIWTASEDKVKYVWGYYLVMTYIGLISLNTLYFIFKNSKLPNTNKRIMLPIVMMIFFATYVVLYVKTQNKYGIGAVEAAVTIAFILVAIIESLILSRLIPSNSSYKKIFENLDIPVIIVDDNYDAVFKSKIDLALDKKEYSKIHDDEILIVDNNKFNAKNIDNGHILWSDDIKEINDKNAELTALNKKLLLKNELLNKQVLLEKKELTLELQSRIYEQIENSTRHKINQISKIIKNNNDISRNNLIKICLVGCYIKRISNIIFVNELYGTINVFELQSAILESISNYKLKNMVHYTEKYIDAISIQGDIIKKVYEYFETELEFYFEKNAELNVYWTIYENNFKLSIKFIKNDITVSNNILDFIDFFNENNIIYKEDSTNDFYRVDITIQSPALS